MVGLGTLVWVGVGLVVQVRSLVEAVHESRKLEARQRKKSEG